MKNINYQLIISDYDGTLANNDDIVSDENKKAISEYTKAGGIFALSTGRLPAMILPLICNLEIKGIICCGNGTVILDIESRNIISENKLSMKTTISACRQMEEMGLHILAFDLWDYYSNKDDGLLNYYESLAKVKAKTVTKCKLSSYLEKNNIAVYKFVALVTPEDNAKVMADLKAKNIAGCEITKSTDFLVEVVNKNISKGTSVSHLSEIYKIPIEKTIAVGDNFNDITMIERAGLGIAVNNAEVLLKERADYVCKYSNNDSAIAEIIQKFGFIQH